MVPEPTQWLLGRQRYACKIMRNKRGLFLNKVMRFELLLIRDKGSDCFHAISLNSIGQGILM